jgi:hypothetical protein
MISLNLCGASSVANCFILRRERMRQPRFSERMKAVGRLSKSLGEIESRRADLVTLKKTTVGGRDVWPAYRMALTFYNRSASGASWN